MSDEKKNDDTGVIVMLVVVAILAALFGFSQRGNDCHYAGENRYGQDITSCD